MSMRDFLRLRLRYVADLVDQNIDPADQVDLAA
jgi:hypothetical protein